MYTFVGAVSNDHKTIELYRSSNGNQSPFLVTVEDRSDLGSRRLNTYCPTWATIDRIVNIFTNPIINVIDAAKYIRAWSVPVRQDGDIYHVGGPEGPINPYSADGLIELANDVWRQNTGLA